MLRSATCGACCSSCWRSGCRCGPATSCSPCTSSPTCTVPTPRRAWWTASSPSPRASAIPCAGGSSTAAGLRATVAPCLIVGAGCWSVAPFLGYWPLLGLAALAGLFVVPSFSIVRQALMHAAPDEQRRTALSVDSVMTEVTFMIGPPIGVLLASVWSTSWTLLQLRVRVGVGRRGALAGEPPVARDRRAPRCGCRRRARHRGADRGEGPVVVHRGDRRRAGDERRGRAGAVRHRRCDRRCPACRCTTPPGSAGNSPCGASGRRSAGWPTARCIAACRSSGCWRCWLPARCRSGSRPAPSCSPCCSSSPAASARRP